MKILAITQARISSRRLPAKVLLPLGKGTVLELHLKRVLRSKKISKLVVATTREEGSSRIVDLCKRINVDCYQGSLDDVLDRFYQVAKIYQPEFIVRITSDCPLIDPFYIDDTIDKFLNNGGDYAANSLYPSLPDGMDVEIFTFKALEEAWIKGKKKSNREHVTEYIRSNKDFKILSIEYPMKLGHVRMTLDTPADYELIKNLVNKAGEDATLEEYIKNL